MTNTTKDPIVEMVQQDLLDRSTVGIRKYGVTLARTDLELADWLQHAYEETLDNANYLKAAIEKLKREQVLLWLDDIRDPLTEDWLVFSPIEQPYKVVWVKNYNEFTDWITNNGLPTAICFDHDLADEHYTPEEYWSDYDKSKAYQEAKVYQEKTGMDCAKWLVDYCMDKEKSLPEWNIQSANPVGADNICALLTNFSKHSPAKLQ